MPRIGGDRRQLLSCVRGDRGAAATLVAVLLAGGVLLGMTALVVDVGQLYAEREELLSGADAGANAIAFDCAMDRAACDDAELTALAYAGLNARDGMADAVVCGSEPGGRLDECTDDAVGNLTDCLNERPDNGVSYVEVRTTTRTAGGTLLPSSFAQTLVSGYEGTTVGACSRVAWGAPATGLGVTFAMCEFNEATNHNERFPPPGASDQTLADYEVLLFTHDSQGSADCWEGPPHMDLPGGFGWLRDEDRNCMVEITDDTYDGRTGNPPRHCEDVIVDAFHTGTPVSIPIYRDAEKVGGDRIYELEGFGAFVITGFKISGSPQLTEASKLTGRNCTDFQPGNQERCLIGYFTQALVDSSEIGEGPIMGALVVRTVG